MPTVLSADEELQAMEKGSSEMRFLLDKEGVSRRVQAILFHNGAVSLGKFSVFFKDDEDLRTVAKDEMLLDPTTSLAVRSELAGLILCFHQARTRTEEVSKMAGELDARRQTKPLLGTEYAVMRNAFETKFYRLEDYEIPARSYIEKRIAELEAGELKAESLKIVLSKEQDMEESLIPSWDNAGNMRLKRASLEMDEPANPEELRKRITLMINGLVFISLQHSNRKELTGISPELANKYCAFLLGDHIWGFVAKDEEGRTIASPNWNLVISYEMAIRKRAYKYIYEDGTCFPDALKQAWYDTLTKDRHFTTPLAIAAATGSKRVDVTGGGKRAYEVEETGQRKALKNTAGRGSSGGRGRGKGGGKGSKGGGRSSKGLEVPKGCARLTPDNKPLCYGYNDFKVRCRNPRCAYEHLCGLCFQKHPMYACNGKAKFSSERKPETQGSGG